MAEQDSGSNFDEFAWIKFRFEESWLKEGKPFEVRDYAQDSSPGDFDLFNELVVLNFDYWSEAHRQKLIINGAITDEPPSVQTYIRQYPEIAEHDSSILELLIIEITNFPNPRLDDYVQDFPKFQEELGAIFELLKLFKPEQLRQWSDSLSIIARALGHSSQTAQNPPPDVPQELMVPVEPEPEPTPGFEKGQVLELIDRFQIIGGEEGVQIGEGAFKRVYKGQQQSTGRPVAVKQLKQLKSENVRSFLSEGRAQAGLEHQSIPPVMLLGDQAGKPSLLVEKLIQAPEWSSLLHSELTLAQNLAILVKVSQAAAYAHLKCDLVHRDIKPQNVLVSEFGEVYLVDWGLAVQVSDEPKLDEAVRQLKEEPAGYILGPPMYMAPEMALGSNQLSTPATDVFLLGAILYEILTGHAPYNAFPRTAVLRAAAHWFPDLPDDAPEELKAITLKAMAKDPAERHIDAGEFADAIQRYQSHVVADEQTAEAERQFAELQQRLTDPSHSSSPSSTLASLIAAADRYRLAGKRWSDSLAEANEARAKEPDEYTRRGMERSLSGERSAREELIAFATQTGDLALAESQVEELANITSNRSEELKRSVEAAQAKRRRERVQRVGAIAATVVTAVGLAISTAVVSSKNDQLEESNRNLVAANQREKTATKQANAARDEANVAGVLVGNSLIRMDQEDLEWFRFDQSVPIADGEKISIGKVASMMVGHRSSVIERTRLDTEGILLFNRALKLMNEEQSSKALPLLEAANEKLNYNGKKLRMVQLFRFKAMLNTAASDEELLRVSKSILQSYPDDPDVIVEVADALIYQAIGSKNKPQRLAEATSILTPLNRKYPGHSYSKLLAAQIDVEGGHFGKAKPVLLELLERAQIKKTPEFEHVIRQQLMHCARGKKDYEKAIELSIKLTESQTARLTDFVYLGRNLQAVGRLEESVDVFKSARSKAGEFQDFVVEVELGSTYLLTGEYEKAVPPLQSMVEDPRFDPDQLIKYGLALAGSGQQKRAVELFTELQPKYFEWAPGYRDYFETHRQQALLVAGDLTDALSVSDSYPRSSPPNQYSRVHIATTRICAVTLGLTELPLEAEWEKVLASAPSGNWNYGLLNKFVESLTEEQRTVAEEILDRVKTVVPPRAGTK